MRVARLQFAVDRKHKAEAAKVEGKQIFDGVKDARMGGAKRVFDLFDGGGDFGRVKGQVAVIGNATIDYYFLPQNAN